MAILAGISGLSGNAGQWQVGGMGVMCLLGCGVIYLFSWRPMSASIPLPPMALRQRAVVSASAALVFVGFSLLDSGLLWALSPLGVSFGSLGPSMAGLCAVRLVLAAAWVFSQRRSTSHQASPFRASALVALLVLNLSTSALAVDGFYVEPQALGVTKLTLSGPAFLPDRPLRLVHLTDLHVERLTRRERDLVARVAALQPDLIVLTGDYINQEYLNDPAARQAAREVLSQLHAPRGVYAVAGTIDAPETMTALFDGLDITVLDNAARRLPFEGGELYLMGVTHSPEALQALMAQAPAGAYTLLLHHMPDLIETAAGLGVDAYLAGHTHGGQVRLPLYGALVTFSAYGKRFEMGRYTVGSTTLYVSRGIGMEGANLPRVRFLCPPELELLSVGGPGFSDP